MASSQGLFLFSVFASAVVLSKLLRRAKAVSMPPIDAQYLLTLQKLFKFTFKLPSRHSATPQMSATELFQQRKTFFLANCFNSDALRKAKIIHIAGTKGKGSTLEYISAGLRFAKDNKVGIFTSPHLHTARERIKIGTSLISKEDVVRLGDISLSKMSNIPWAVFFDILLSLAMQYFSEHNVDYIVMEAGIGGRYDSTNFLDKSDVSVITSISLDHQALLGNTVEEIAWQKAGIIKMNGNVFTSAAQDARVMSIIRQQCIEMNATLHVVPVSREEVEALDLRISYVVQIQNACLAIAVLKFLDVSTEGLKDFFWPCRMESFVINDVTVILDGCHNDDSVRQFIQGLKEKYPDSSLLVLFGAGMEKYLPEMLTHVFESADNVLMVQSRHFKSLPEEDLAAAVESRCQSMLITSDGRYSATPLLPRVTSGTVSERLMWSIQHAQSQRKASNREVVVAVCGSLFAAAEAREVLFRESPSSFSAHDWVRHADLMD